MLIDTKYLSLRTRGEQRVHMKSFVEHNGMSVINFVSKPSQGDYDGSGQQSCKCNYVDFSK